MVPVHKKNGKLCVCIDFRNLNKATPMDGDPMPVADLLVDATSGHKRLSVLWMGMLVQILGQHTIALACVGNRGAECVAAPPLRSS